MADPTQVGRWDAVFPLPNVAIHTHLLPDGTVLFWGRRDDPGGSMNDHAGTPHVWNPATGATTPTSRPTLADGTTVNLFCSGHAFLPDGRLLVAGGHLADGNGVNQACTYDHVTGAWTPLPLMNGGRWYPTVTTLADGRALVASGSAFDGNGNSVVSTVSQIGDGGPWLPTVDFIGLPLYPRMHVVPDGRVFMAGSNPTTYLLDTAANSWTPVGPRINGDRQYAPSVQYGPGKVAYIGGGNDAGTDLPTAATEVIDLAATPPTWRAASPMGFRRRQHNATLLPDGTVLVTGGTGGPGFNDVSPGRPVHTAELWDPVADTWTELAAEDVDRCYHATALLLPDATVLSAGGGEFMVGASPNAPADTHRDAQVFHPPYLFRGPRPEIVDAPAEITPGEPFDVHAPGAATVSLVRLGSVTHAFDQNQRFVALPGTTGLTAPAGLPPGHYMLFALSTAGVPSVARILRLLPAPAPGPRFEARAVTAAAARSGADRAGSERAGADRAGSERAGAARTGADRAGADRAGADRAGADRAGADRAGADRAGADRAGAARTGSGRSGTDRTGMRVTVGLTAQCPYGLGPCWGGAYEALNRLDDVAAVDPVADTADSTAVVHLRGTGLPDLRRWPAQIARSAGGGYAFRGVELTVTGPVVERDGRLVLLGPEPLRLRALRPGTELAWDLATRGPRPATATERNAYRDLRRRAEGGPLTVTVTGPARRTRTGWSLLVRVVD